MPNLIGYSLGRYHILEQLGEGGMATVYKAYDTRLERDVAVKVIRKSAFSSEVLERMLKRFEREAKALARLTHPNIVGVIDYGEYEGSPFLVMPYLPGGTLKLKLGKPIPWQDSARLLLPIARALRFAHQQGIIHRDVKPSNILITLSGEPMLTDFGIAKILESEEVTALTSTGMGVGTPEYMAPEQWTGNVSPQSDIYALGVVFYEMVTGRKPYIADTPPAIMLKQATEPLPRPVLYVPDLPEMVEIILIKALARQPADRFIDMGSFIDALESVQTRVNELKPITTTSKSDFLGSDRVRDSQDTFEQDRSKEIITEEATQDEVRQDPILEKSTSKKYDQQLPLKKTRVSRWVWLVGGGFGCLVVVLLGVVVALSLGWIRLGSPASPIPAVTSNYSPAFPAPFLFTPTVLPSTSSAVTPALANSPMPVPANTSVPTITNIPSLEPAPTSSTPTRADLPIGYSVDGVELIVTCLGNGVDTLVVAGAIHGDERNSASLVQNLLTVFSQYSLSSNYTICFLPALNPDGVQKGTRNNSHGIDLNRNWYTTNWRSDTEGPGGTVIGAGGSHPFSEPETKAFSSFLLSRKQQSSGGFVEIMYHAQYPPDGLVQPGYLKQGATYIPDSQAARLASLFSIQINSTYSETYPAYEITGELINWCAEQGISCFDVELPDLNNPGTSAVQLHFNAILDLLEILPTLH